MISETRNGETIATSLGDNSLETMTAHRTRIRQLVRATWGGEAGESSELVSRAYGSCALPGCTKWTPFFDLIVVNHPDYPRTYCSTAHARESIVDNPIIPAS